MIVLLAPQHGADAGEQLGGGKRLRQIIVRTRVKSLYSVLHRVAGGEHEDRHGDSFGADGVQHFNTAAPGHHPVKDDPVIVACLYIFQCVLTVVHDVNGVARALQERPHRLCYVAVVFGK